MNSLNRARPTQLGGRKKTGWAAIPKMELGKLSLVLVGFAALCFATSLVMNSDTGDRYQKVLPPTGGMIGPITIKDDNTVYEIKVAQDIKKAGQWSYVEGEVLNSQKSFMFSFGKELWKKQRDYNTASTLPQSTLPSSGIAGVSRYDLKVTFAKAGDYYLRFKTNTSLGASQAVGTSIQVTAQQLQGSSIFHLILGIVSLFFALSVFGKFKQRRNPL